MADQNPITQLIKQGAPVKLARVDVTTPRAGRGLYQNLGRFDRDISPALYESSTNLSPELAQTYWRGEVQTVGGRL